MENPDSALHVRFYNKAVRNERKSREQGRAIHEDRVMIEIRFPGDSKRELVAFADEVHMNPNTRQQMTYAERFPEHYAVYQADSEELVHGTPLSELPALTEAKRADLRAQNIKTVEQLAGLTDAAMSKVGFGTRDLVVAAQSYLERASGVSEVNDLKAKIAEFEALMEQNTAPPAKDIVDEFEGLSDSDLKNMIKDAGGSVPSGKPTRETLVKALQDIAAEKEAA